ncbi:MAG: MoxR family ATPase [Thermoguttaceae bacterium]|jgi:MoxR-like ATPase
MSTAHLIEPHLAAFREDFDALRHELTKVVVGQADVIEQVLIAAVAGGHVLIEGVPGLGKTLLVQTLADILQLRFSRIQFTPDLTPSDLLGTFVVMETATGRRTFEFQQGPIFSNLVLADQINRGLPKTQSALLQAMEGEVINVSTETFHLPQPFFVVGTQNPLEMEGTFPLPESEIDRFFFKLVMKGPSVEELDAILERTTESAPAEVRAVVDGKRLLEMRETAGKVGLPAPGRRWVASLVAATHPDFPRAPEAIKRYVRYGASPRAAQALVVAAKVHAAAGGRTEVAKEDFAATIIPALRHRIMLNFEGQAESIRPESLIDSIVKSIG